MLRRSAVVARPSHNFLFICTIFCSLAQLFVQHIKLLFTAITRHLRRLRPLYLILAHPIAQCLCRHTQQASRTSIP